MNHVLFLEHNVKKKIFDVFAFNLDSSKKTFFFCFSDFLGIKSEINQCDLPIHDLVNLSNKLLLKLIWNCTE